MILRKWGNVNLTKVFKDCMSVGIPFLPYIYYYYKLVNLQIRRLKVNSKSNCALITKVFKESASLGTPFNGYMYYY